MSKSPVVSVRIPQEMLDCIEGERSGFIVKAVESALERDGLEKKLFELEMRLESLEAFREELEGYGNE